MSKKNTSNPDIETILEGDVVDGKGSDGFFENLEQQVNGQVNDGPEESQPETEQATQPQADSVDTGNEGIDWKQEAETLKQRYSDSTREAQRLRTQLKGAGQLAQYKPLIQHLQNSPSAIQALKDDINGGSKEGIAKKFGEDFVFDGHEAVTDPNSNSAKALKQMIDSEADKRVNARMQAQSRKSRAKIAEMKQKKQINDFVQKTGISQDELAKMQQWASKRELTMDDIYYLMNKEKVADNVANNTKQDMLNQMKNVRDMPTSASGANSQGQKENPDDDIFEGLLDLDGGVDNLFG